MGLKKLVAVACTAVAVAGFGAAIDDAHAKKTEVRTDLRCRARTTPNTHLHVRYESRVREDGRSRARFRADFEASRVGMLVVGQSVTFKIDDVVVGTETFRVSQGELVADLYFDSRSIHQDRQFPTDFPDVVDGSVVTAEVDSTPVVSLSCELVGR